MQVITWQTPSDDQLDICSRCQSACEASGEWPRSDHGEEYCSVSRGMHRGFCDLCQSETD